MASSGTGSSNLVRFGGEFELDLSTYELRQAGQSLKLERIPTEVLLLLIEQRGQLVSRQQIVERVWGKDVFLDTDNSINAAIRKIRLILKDDPEQPRFVQTLTGRGYRFIASVEEAVPAPPVPRAPSVAPENLLGKKVSHYRILEVLGGGGMGVVYKAEDLKLGRRVALKFLPSELSSDPRALDRMQREARAASSLDHPNICAIYELGEHEGQPFIAMQLLEGQTLREWIEKAPEPFESRFKQIVELGLQIADGLDAAHQKGIVHRDIKPANIFVTNLGQAKILDFGIAEMPDASESRDLDCEGALKPSRGNVSDTHSTHTGASIGTPSYLSPEQIRREKLDGRTDLFSFGLVLYEMATARRAFSGNTATVIRNAVLNLPEVPAREVCPDVPIRLENIISKSLNKDRELRYQSAAEMRTDLMELRAAAPGAKPVWRRGLIWVAAALVSGVLAAVIFEGQGIRQKLLQRAEAQKAAGINARKSVAVLGFRNLSGRQDQAWISTALSEMLNSDLSAGHQLRVIPGEDVARMQLDLNLPAADDYSRDTLRRIRDYLGSDVVVLGSYLATGNDAGGKVRIDLQLQDARAGETIGAIQSDGTEAQLAELVSQGGAALRRKLGEPDVSASDAGQISGSIPTNPEAARLYAEGLAKLQSDEALGARDLLEKSLVLDPKHALSHSALSQTLFALGYEMKAEGEAKLALDLSANLPREQRLSIEGRYDEYAHDLPGAIEIYKTLRNFFPDDLDYALRLASAQSKADLQKDALQTLARARQLPKPDGDDARISLTEAVALEFIGDFQGEQRAAAEAAQKAQERGGRWMLAQAITREAWSWERRGEVDKALLLSHQARDLAESLQNQRLHGLSLRQIGIIDEDKGDYQAARASHQSALEIFQKIGAKRLVARALESLGNIDYEQERLAEAKRYYEDALRVDREVAAAPGSIGSDLGNIANVLDSSGDLVGATEMQGESLKAFRAAGDRRGESDVLLNLGNVLVERGELDLAKQNYDQARIIAAQISYKAGEASLLAALVDVYLAQDRLPEARDAAQKSVALREELKEKTSVGRSHLQVARVALEEGRAAESEQLARAAAPIFEEQKMAGDASVCAAILTRALVAQSRIDDARAVADKSLSFAHQTVDRSSNLFAALAAAEVDIREGKARNAAKALESVRAQAASHGYRDLEFQARLDLGKLLLQSGQAEKGRTELKRLQSDALNSGFLRTARKAQVAQLDA